MDWARRSRRAPRLCYECPATEARGISGMGSGITLSLQKIRYRIRPKRRRCRAPSRHWTFRGSQRTKARRRESCAKGEEHRKRTAAERCSGAEETKYRQRDRGGRQVPRRARVKRAEEARRAKKLLFLRGQRCLGRKKLHYSADRAAYRRQRLVDR